MKKQEFYCVTRVLIDLIQHRMSFKTNGLANA